MSTVLQFSGGKDSLACLYLLEQRWSDIVVAWVNTGAAFPETLELMERVRKMVPDFREIRGTQNIAEHGFPVDVLPIAATSLGALCEGHEGMRFQSRYSCCAAALWGPMRRALSDWGAKVIIRGQKRCDAKRTPLKNGEVIDGIEVRFPLYEWTDAEVRDYLIGRGVALPGNYELMTTGLDCWNCTAYLDENKGRLEYMRLRHPEKFAHVSAVLKAYRGTLEHELAPLMRTA